ncbi:hypothetical protein [Sediminibacterium sp. C3]|uniref:hypothetical protein n=1 Tax=Sediminibacterium sp. C3 TaxID=1267211 RepID=UPI000405D864|nr:hypothetical protein [Sediminibacterium sp. C3]
MDELKKYLKENRSALDLDEPGPQGWEKVQARLQQERPAAKVVPIKKYFQWSVAACVFVLAGIGLWSLLETKPEKLQQQVLRTPNESVPNKNAMVGVENKSESPANVATEKDGLKSDRNIVNTANHSSNGINKPLANKQNNSGSQGLSKDVLASLASVENGFTQVINLQRGKISTTPMYAESAAYFNEFKMQIQQIEADERQLKKEISKKGLTANQLDQLIDLYQYKLTVLKQLQLEMNKTNNRFKQNRGPVDSTRAYFINI